MCVIQPYVQHLPPTGSFGKFYSIPLRMEKPKLRCKVLHLPLDQRIKTSVSPMDLAKSRLSEERFHGVHTFHGHVLCDEDLEVMEI